MRTRAAMVALLVILAASCDGRGESAADAGAEPAAAARTPVTPGETPGDLGFQAAVTELGEVQTWGALALGDHGAPHRLATLAIGVVIETRPGQLVLVSYAWAADPWGGLDPIGDFGHREPGQPPRWTVQFSRSLRIGGTRQQGSEYLEIGVRDGVVVVLAHSYARDGRGYVRAYATDGVCAAPCPPLAGFAAEELMPTIAGPSDARTLKRELFPGWTVQRERRDATRANPSFTAIVREHARARRQYVSGWGTLRLDGSERSYPVATLRSIDLPARARGLRPGERATVIVELAPDRRVLIDLPEDVHNRISFGGPGAWMDDEPVWQDQLGTTLVLEKYAGPGNSDRYRIGVHAGQLVMREHGFILREPCTAHCPLLHRTAGPLPLDVIATRE